MPLFSTPTQFAVLAILFVAGWFFGLASHPGGRKWKERYTAERDAHAANRKEAETRIAAANKGQDERLTAANQRVADLERENAALRKAAPVTAQTIAPQPASAARPAYPTGQKRGWFEFDRR